MESKSALLVGAHPDDWALGVFGTASLLSKRGWAINCLALTSGELAGDATVREAEDLEVARMLGANLRFGRLADSNLDGRTAAGLIEQLIATTNASLVFAHSGQDRHGDHVAAAEAAVVACRRGPSLLFYESLSTSNFHPSLYVDVTSEWPTKIAGLKHYSTQSGKLEISGWADAVSTFRAWPYHPNRRIEAFVPHHIGFATLCNLGLGIGDDSVRQNSKARPRSGADDSERE